MIPVDKLWQRAMLIQTIRQFFIVRGYLEVETPLRLPTVAPEADIEPVPTSNWFLQTSPELCMKRLLAAGSPKLFQICKAFRKGERGANHIPEFTILEWYQTDTDYSGLMTECEVMIKYLAKQLNHGNTLQINGKQIRVDTPWERITVKEAFIRHGSISLNEALHRNMFDEILVTDIEPQLGKKRPLFLYDYPVALASLAKAKSNNPEIAERFELYMNGLELANGFSELIDTDEQYNRFIEERKKIRDKGQIPPPLPKKFLAALSNMQKTAGIALGVDRLAMIFMDAANIDEVVAFYPEEL